MGASSASSPSRGLGEASLRSDACGLCAGRERSWSKRVYSASRTSVPLAVTAAVGALLVPKCPLCLLAWLPLLGFSLSAPRALWPLWMLVLLACGAFLWRAVSLLRGC